MPKLTPEQILERSPEAEFWMAVTAKDAENAHEAAVAFVTPQHQRRDVLRALNANVTMIQNWQTRGQVTLDADVVRDGQEWRLYSSRDVLLLGLAVRLSEVGFRASLLQGVLDQVKPIFKVGSPYLSANRASYVVVMSDGKMVGPEIGSSIDLEDIPHGNFIVVRLDKLIREALEPLGMSVTHGNADSMRATARRLSKHKTASKKSGG